MIPAHHAIPNPHAHIRAKSGIDEDLDSSVFSAMTVEDSGELLNKFLVKPEPDRDLLVLPSWNIESLVPRMLSSMGDSSRKLNIDLPGAINVFLKSNPEIYSTRISRLPMLLDRLRRINPALNPRKDLIILDEESASNLTMIGNDTLLAFDSETILEKLSSTRLGSLIRPFRNTFKKAIRSRPEVLEDWIPSDLFENMESVLENARFRLKTI